MWWSCTDLGDWVVGPAVWWINTLRWLLMEFLYLGSLAPHPDLGIISMLKPFKLDIV
jgi:hypothetical protein